MQGRRIEAYAVLVAEWVLGDGDGGVPVRLRDGVSWCVRPADEGDEASAARLIAEDRVAAGQAELSIFALHVDDPEPTVSLVGRVTLIQALSYSRPPNGKFRLLSQRMVDRAWINEGVEDYLVHVEGTVAARYERLRVGLEDVLAHRTDRADSGMVGRLRSDSGMVGRCAPTAAWSDAVTGSRSEREPA